MESLLLVAHVGKEHLSQSEIIIHELTNSWYLAPLLILAGSLFVFSVYLLFHRSKTAALTATQICLLFGGVALFQLVPILSITCIITGFVLSLVFVINGLRSNDEPKT